MKFAKIDERRLVGRWVHSHEEGEGDRVIFRTSDFSFPPSRGRIAMILEPNGVAKIEYPGPDDRHATASGRWVLEGTVLTITTPVWARTFEVSAVDEHLLAVNQR